MLISYYLLNFSPSQIPTNPPTAPQIIDEKDSSFAPHKSGKKLPRAEPMTIPVYITFFESIFTILYILLAHLKKTKYCYNSKI